MKRRIKWDDSSGYWQGLDSPIQTPRYRAIAECIANFCPHGMVLDVGCGEAVLWEHMPAGVHLVGVEPSAVAIAGGRAKYGDQRLFHVAAEDFDASETKWDCIIFNEMLYHCKDPVGLIEKYSQFLTSRGRIVISIYQKESQRVGVRKYVQHLLDRRRPKSKMHCTHMIERLIEKKHWQVAEDRLIVRPGSDDHWRMWVVGRQS